MGGDVFAHRVTIESVDCGSAAARLDPQPQAGGIVAPEAVLALAHHSCGAAVQGIARAITGEIRCTPSSSSVTHLRAASGAICAAALVERELPVHVADDLRRNGSAHARVNVAMVDDTGETVALGTFEFFIAHA